MIDDFSKIKTDKWFLDKKTGGKENGGAWSAVKARSPLRRPEAGKRRFFGAGKLGDLLSAVAEGYGGRGGEKW